MKLSTLIKARKMARDMELAVGDNLGVCIYHRKSGTPGVGRRLTQYKGMVG